MAVQVITAAQAAQASGIKGLVYGPSGAGKTVLCGTAPAPVVISAERGLRSLAQILPTTACIEVQTYNEMYDAYLWATSSREAQAFATLCLDSATEIAEVVLTDLKRQTKDPRKAYGELQDTVLSMFRYFRDIPGKNVVFTAKQDMQKDGLTGAQSFRPMMPGQALPLQLPYFFDEVFQLHAGKNADGQEFRALRTRRDVQYEAKDRSGRLAEWEPADLTYVFNKINGKG